MKKHLANILTGLRIFCSFLLLSVPVFSKQFSVLYLLCGISDMTDGIAARVTGSASEFGARLDTFADFLFLVVAFVKLLPSMDIPGWQWIWITAIAVIKFSNVIRGFVRRKQLISVHTVLNKITGLLLFLFPLMRTVFDLTSYVGVLCFLATFAAIQESCYIRKEERNVFPGFPNLLFYRKDQAPAWSF